MAFKHSGGGPPSRTACLDSARAQAVPRRRRGVILLAVLVFIALLLPLITLVMTSINTESVSTAEAIKGAKANLAAEKAVNDAITLVVQQKESPNYWESVGQPNTAITVNDPVTGQRRNLLNNTGAGIDTLYGTDDDYWVGPRGDRSFSGATDNATATRNYRYGFAFSQRDAPTYIGQAWSFSTDNRQYGTSPFGGGTIWLLNQFAAVDATDSNADGIDDGYDPSQADPFLNDTPVLRGPGYYAGRDGGPESALPTRDLTDPAIEQAMYNAKVNIYESVYSDLDRGPMPSSLLKSYANVSDEAGRLNLNTFCKKVRVYASEDAGTDYDFDGYATENFNGNRLDGERGWKWMDNPLFPDRVSTRKLELNTADGSFTDPGGANGRIDWGGIDETTGLFNGTLDAYSMPDLGESVQHYYEGDTDGDGIPQSVEAMRRSIDMLVSLGLTPLQAARLLTFLNPPQDAGGSAADSDPFVPGSPNSPTYPTLNSALNGVATLPYDSNPLLTDPTVNYPFRRLDACNLTPPLLSLDITVDPLSGVVSQFRFMFDRTDEDDMPLPQPHQLRSIDELRDIPGFTETTVERLRDKVTIFSYDTNVIANYVSDVSSQADLVNAYLPGDPQYTGSSLRRMPNSLKDQDNYTDLRYDVSQFVFGLDMSDYRQVAEEMYAYLREHLPRPLFDKITLPVVDRLGRADSADSELPNDDPMYDVASVTNPGVLLPHRDSDDDVNGTGRSHPYNVGALGRERTVGNTPGAGYPALNPAFSLDSCLSLVLYRNGSAEESDAYTYNPQNGAWRASIFRLPLSMFPPSIRQFIARFARFIFPSLAWGGNPNPNLGFNLNAQVRPHGAGVYDYANLLNPGSFDTVADTLDVPLYAFDKLSISMMADPPSGFRFDADRAGDVDTWDTREQAPVNYYVTFSDVVDRSWYMANVYPFGPDRREGTADDLTVAQMNTPLYTVYFTRANRTGGAPADINPDPNNPSAYWDAVVPVTPAELEIVGAGIDGTGTKVTVQFHDTAPPYTDPVTGRTYYRGKRIIDDDYVSDPRWLALPANVRPTGTLSPAFNWREVPYPEEQGTAGAVGADVDGRPDQNGDWPFNPTPGGASYRSAWAYDDYGDPYLMARAEVVREWQVAASPTTQPRADDACRVYLQYNERAEIPFRVSILPVRVSGNEFEIRSAFGGASTYNGTYLLYDWDIPGTTNSFDGTWPESQPGQAGNPQTIRVTPRDTTGGGLPVRVSLRLYDLRTFVDTADPDGAGALTRFPIQTGYVNLGPAVWTGSDVQTPPSFPASYGANPGGYPVEADPGYAIDGADVSAIDAGDIVRTSVTAEEPSIYRDEAQVPVRVSAAGGHLNYTYRIRVLSSQFGDPTAAGGAPYQGPDLGAYGGDGSTWPLPFVNYPWEAGGALPRHSELSLFSFISPPNPPNIVAFNHYDASVGGSVLQTLYRGDTDDLDFSRDLDFTGLNDPYYWVEVAVWDSNPVPPGINPPDPADAYAYTKVVVSTDRQPAGSTGTPPNMNASLNLTPLTTSGPGQVGQLGFTCSVSVDGGTGGYNYYWEVDRPVYAGSTVTGMEIVDSNGGGPFVGTTEGPMTATTSDGEPGPTFVFEPDTSTPNHLSPYGVYFVHVYVMDHASSAPSMAVATLAHDVAMVTVNDTGVSPGGVPSADSLARNPMSLLYADPPGNSGVHLGTNSRGAGGSDPPYIGSAIPDPTQPAVQPDIAGIGDVVIIRGFNFDPVANNNVVRFAGDVEARAFGIRTVPGYTFDPPPAGGTLYTQQELFVVVPTGAQPGELNVGTSGGVSESVFFQTGFNVTFDLLGSLSATDPAYLRFELDYQGDGNIDYTYDTLLNPSLGGIVRGDTQGVVHDYASDGVGNYDATLVVTDLVSGRHQVSHQLVMVKDLRPTAGFITIATGIVSAFNAGNNTLTDASATFLTMGTIDPTWSIVNVRQPPPANPYYGLSTTIVSVVDNQNMVVGGNIFVAGDVYEIRKNLNTAVNNGMLDSIWPRVEMRSESFTAKPGPEGMEFFSSVGGTSSSGVRYKWAIDRNEEATNVSVPNLVTFNATGVLARGGFPPVFVLTTDLNLNYLNLPPLPFNVIDDSDAGAVWRVTAIPGETVPGFGVLTPFQLLVEYLSGGTLRPGYEWRVGENGHVEGLTNGSGSAGQVTAGAVYNVPGGPNNPGYALLDNLLIDNNNNFQQVGPVGVKVGDLTFNSTDGSIATVLSIDSQIQLRVWDGVDPSHATGLLNGVPQIRGGLLTGRAWITPPGTIPAVMDMTQAGYNFHGRGAPVGTGGMVVGDGNPANFNVLGFGAESHFWNLNDYTGWFVSHVNDPGPNEATMQATYMGNIPNPWGVAPGNGNGIRGGAVTAVAPLGGLPPNFVLTTPVNWSVLTLPPVPFDVYNFNDNRSVWRVTAVPGQTVPGFGVLAANQIRVEFRNDGTAPSAQTWAVGNQVYVILLAQWATGDRWEIQIPRDEWRINYRYSVRTDAGGGPGGSTALQGVWADCSFADLGAPVDFYVNIQAPYRVAVPSTVEFDWNGDGVADQASRSQIIVNGDAASTQSTKATHEFISTDLAGPCNPAYPSSGRLSRAHYRTIITAYGQTAAVTSSWQGLPLVIVGGDHYDNSLRTLNVGWGSSLPHSWDNSQYHRVDLETGFQTTYNLQQTAPAGLNNLVRRWYFASDQLYIPPGLSNYGRTLSTFASSRPPFFYANINGATTMRHQAVHGLGSALNWLSDANADARWSNALNLNESPLGLNPQNYFEYTFPNGANLMNVPGAGVIKGASFPKALPGVGRVDTTGGFIYYQATHGCYNSFGFVSDNLPSDERGFSFDSQALFWGDRLYGGQGSTTRPLSADFFIRPLVGANTELVQLVSYVTSASEVANYTYLWTVQRRSVLDPWTSTAANPTFDPVGWAQRAGGPGDSGADIYDVYLSVNGGATFTAKRSIDIRPLLLNTFLMANPPSGSMDTAFEFPTFTEGGTPPYSLQINYGDGSPVETQVIDSGNEFTFSHQFTRSGSYSVAVTVTDSLGAIDTDTEVVDVAETVPLNVTMLVSPPSGVAPFLTDVHYAVSGGSPMADGGYSVVVRLVSPGSFVGGPATFRSERNTFGPNGRLDDPRLAGADDEPVTMTIPAPGNYTISVVAMDSSGNFVMDTENVWASGYMSPAEYGNSAPQVVRDEERRPMNAVRIWRDPFLSRGETGSAEDYSNRPDLNTTGAPGGRLMEGDLEVLGDILTTDPNQVYRSFGMLAEKNPLDQPLYVADLSGTGSPNQTVHDYYDTFTEGRININTASEEVLTALFRHIIKERHYAFDMTVGTQTVRSIRDPGADVYLSDAEARDLARAVVKYRTAYYDLHKPDVPGATDDAFGYRRAAGTAPLNAAFRVDHLPAIGPWDGVNPHDYSATDRTADLPDCDATSAGTGLHNAYDHMAGSYYNFDPSNNSYLFYAPSDVGIVRTPWEGTVSLDDTINGQQFSLTFREPLSNYAKYLNDTVMDDLWSNDRGPYWTDWADLGGLYQDADNYSRWAFDARNYFTYSGGQASVALSFPPQPSDHPLELTPGTLEDVGVARNRMAVINSNGETAYTYIANPPFRSVFDLYNVIAANMDPTTYGIEQSGATWRMTLASGSPGIAGTTILNTNTWSGNARVFSGPSVFRYAAHWDDQACEFLPVANYLDDIAPYVTCRSYVFRVEAAGAVTASGGTEGSMLDNAKVARDRAKMAVIDVGPKWARRDVSELTTTELSQGLRAPSPQASYTILWSRDDQR